MRNTILGLVILAAAMASACAKAPARPAPVPQAGNAYVAPQSAPVLAPSYPSLAGEPMQPATASIPLVQGR